MKIKRLLAPRFWKVPKKVAKWIVAPRPGPHKKFESIPLQIIVRDILKLAETGKEAKNIIKRGEIIVDGRARKDHGYPAGLMDVIAVPRINQFYRLVPSAIGLSLINIPEKEARLKLCRIDNKTVVKKGRLQLNLHDGRNLLVDKDVYKTGDSILLELPEQRIIKHVKMESGSLGLIIKGKNAGSVARIKDVKMGRMREPSKAVCEVDDKEIEVVRDYIFVVGKEEPSITVSEKMSV